MVKRINLNVVAKKVTLEEGLKKSVSVAQVKEVIKLYNIALTKYRPSSILELLERSVK